MFEKLPPSLGHLLEDIRPGLDKLIWAQAGVEGAQSVVVSSVAFRDGGSIPVRFTEDGARLSPPIAWSGVPMQTRSVVLVIEDADSPTPAPVVHALVYGLPGSDGGLGEGDLPSKGSEGSWLSLGRNSFRAAQYLAPDPPPGHGGHRYVFQIYALDHARLSGQPEKHDVIAALKGHVLARGRMIGLYERQSSGGRAS